MKNILLLGAGFSRNWRGWLASEVFDYLLGCRTVRTDLELKQIIWKHKNNFEDALALVQGEYRRTQGTSERRRLYSFQDALTEMFEHLDKAYRDTQFEFQNHVEFLVRTFMVRFDAIFTLNQDTLLERHYLNDNVQLGSNGKWHGWQLPGVNPVNDPGRVPFDGNLPKWSPTSSSECLVREGLQPCFKLHGSSNWIANDAEPLLIMGGNKSETLQSHPVLQWYFKEFIAQLSEHVRLMVIGYSFRDIHINRVLIDAAAKNNLQLFIVDPLGSDAIGQGNMSRGGAIYDQSEVEEMLEPALIGASRRPLSDIFGSDRAEHNKLMRFFES